MRATLLLLTIGCQPPAVKVVPDTGARPPTDMTAVDHSLSSGFSGLFEGHYERGRACAPADFDGDGRLDLAIASPGDSVRILLNRSTGPGDFRWENGQVLSRGMLGWALGAADFDNDGDADLMVAHGGNEADELNQLFRNDDGVLVDITPDAVAGPLGVLGEPVASQTAGVIWADFNNDGRLDLFLSTQLLERENVAPGQPLGLDQLLLGNGDGTFVDHTLEAGLDRRAASMNSTAADLDGDGDVDLYQNVLKGKNALWVNHLDSTGALSFEDLSIASTLGPADRNLSQPIHKSYSAAPADFDNDGDLDLMVWNRGPAVGPAGFEGHFLWMNEPNRGFVEVADSTGFNANWTRYEDQKRGVMGSQLGDLNQDGVPDVFTGTGGPSGGNYNLLWMSTGARSVQIDGVGSVEVPQYASYGHLIDQAVDTDVPWPYRTHGACVADYDGDGRPDLAFVNGGPGYMDDVVREPNRLFSFESEVPNRWLAVELQGNGTTSNRDAIGARVVVEVRMSDGSERTFYETMLRGTGFSSHNSPKLNVGLGQAEEVLSLTVRWPDGAEQPVDVPGLDQRISIVQQ